MDFTLTNTELLVKILGGILGIGVIVGGWVFGLLKRHYARTEAQFDALEADLRRDIGYLERQNRDLKESRRELREDLRRCLDRKGATE